MPCMCWFDPPESSKRLIKNLCQQIVNEIKILEEEGDPIGCRIEDIQELLLHMYEPSKCTEKKE